MGGFEHDIYNRTAGGINPNRWRVALLLKIVSKRLSRDNARVHSAHFPQRDGGYRKQNRANTGHDSTTKIGVNMLAHDCYQNY
jgi:hypothetical protein